MCIYANSFAKIMGFEKTGNNNETNCSPRIYQLLSADTIGCRIAGQTRTIGIDPT